MLVVAFSLARRVARQLDLQSARARRAAAHPRHHQEIDDGLRQAVEQTVLRSPEAARAVCHLDFGEPRTFHLEQHRQKTVQAANAEESTFDAFLNDLGGDNKSPGKQADQQVASTNQDSPFAEFDAFDSPSQTEADVADKVNDETPAANPFSQDSAVAAEFAAPFDDDPFQETSRKHGFTRHNKDPWAALAKTSPPQPESDSQANAGQTFAWANSVKPQVPTASPQPEDELPVQRDEFRQVSLTRSADLNTPEPIEFSDSEPLLIPGHTDTGQGIALFEDTTAQTVEPATQISNDPFLTSVPFETAADSTGEAAATPADVAPVAATKSGGLWEWSGRTWFLLIGCLIVAFLLFAPDRQNRTNA